MDVLEKMVEIGIITGEEDYMQREITWSGNISKSTVNMTLKGDCKYCKEYTRYHEHFKAGEWKDSYWPKHKLVCEDCSTTDAVRERRLQQLLDKKKWWKFW